MKTQEKHIKTARVILILLGALCTLYGLEVIALIGAGHWFNFAFIIVGCGLFLIAALLEWLCSRRAVFGAIMLVIVTLAAVTCVLLSQIIGFSQQEPSDTPRYIIVLGAKVEGTQPKKELAERLRTAARLAELHPDAKIIVTGGRGKDELLSEADVSKNYLKIELGISESRILAERESTTTEENLEFAKKLIAEDGADFAAADIIIVSSSFHLFRADKLAKAAGYENTSYAGCSGLLILIPHFYIREVAANVKLWLGEVF